MKKRLITGTRSVKDFLWAFIIFFAGYFLNMFYITVLYHRGLTHKSILMGPKMMRWLSWTGIWVTGIDPKSWCLMHRIHHAHSDREGDPHSPMNEGIFGVAWAQYKSYLFYRERMILKDSREFNQLMADVPFGVSFGTQRWMNNIPYIVHIILAVVIAYFLNSKLLAFAYFAGIMSHPVQGWLINSIAHYYGRRNFELEDNSKNNLILSYFVFGEGLQNNHHALPQRANFAVKFPEFDPGYMLCLGGASLGFFKIRKAQ